MMPRLCMPRSQEGKGSVLSRWEGGQTLVLWSTTTTAVTDVRELVYTVQYAQDDSVEVGLNLPTPAWLFINKKCLQTTS